MLALGFVWLALLVIEFIWGLSRLLEIIGTAIWVVLLATSRSNCPWPRTSGNILKNNWLSVLALLLPALRVFRIVRVARVVRAARATRGLRLVRIISSLNRGMKALGATMGRRGFGYVVALTVVVTLVGAAGIYAFENELPLGTGLKTYGAALWWTAMMMTTLGSEYWPQTAEGRVLCFLLALYAFAVFGYVTATLTTFFVGRDAENEEAELASAQSIKELRYEIQALREEVQMLLRNQMS